MNQIFPFDVGSLPLARVTPTPPQADTLVPHTPLSVVANLPLVDLKLKHARPL